MSTAQSLLVTRHRNDIPIPTETFETSFEIAAYPLLLEHEFDEPALMMPYLESILEWLWSENIIWRRTNLLVIAPIKLTEAAMGEKTWSFANGQTVFLVDKVLTRMKLDSYKTRLKDSIINSHSTKPRREHGARKALCLLHVTLTDQL